MNKNYMKKSSNFRMTNQSPTVSVYANFLEINKLPGMVYHYHVGFEPEINKKYITKRFRTLMKNSENQEFLSIAIAFDGSSMLVTDKKLKNEVNDINYTIGSKENLIEAKCIITYKNTYCLNDILNVIAKKINIDISTHIQCLEIILRQFQCDNFIIDKNKMFSNFDIIRLTEKLVVYTGIYQTVKITQNGLFCNADLVFTVMYDSMLITELLEEILRSNLPYNYNKNISLAELISINNDPAKIYQNLESFIKKIKIRTVHTQKNYSFKIIGLSTESADKLKFEFEGKMISVADFFEQKYTKLNHPYLPCLVKLNKDKKHCFYPMETCKIEANQRYLKKLNEKETSLMVKIAAKQPTDRFRILNEKIQELQLTKNAVLDKFKIKIDNDYLICRGRVLDPPNIHYGALQPYPIVPNRGSWQMKGVSAIEPRTINNWIFCFLNNANFNRNETKENIGKFIDFARSYGLILNPNYRMECVTTPNEYAKLINDKKPEFVMFILSGNRNEVYEQVKKISETNQFKIVTQCIYILNLRKFTDPSFCANIMIKINVKMKGKNWKISGNGIETLKKNSTIILGADVSHPGVGDLENPSIAALVASMDSDLQSYSTNISFQERRQEKLNDLKSNIKIMFIKYRTKNKILPERLIFFRDGLGDNQFKSIYEEEIKDIKQACSDLYQEKLPEINFLIAQKRHSVRFCMKNSQYNERSKGPIGNVPAGTIIDDIKHYNERDFYVVTHHAIQGTSHPVRYHLMLNESNFSRIEVYGIINDMCYLYPRATKAVSIVPPVYFAHLAAARAKCYLNGNYEFGKTFENLGNLEDQLFYL
ncbi:hypothetical protein GVAV_000205 [Gurleya vavrai]